MVAPAESPLRPEQARDLAAICERILPPGPDGPGASEAHVPQYIEGQLSGPWGAGARMYRSPPFLTPEDAGHGWQLDLTPAEVYVRGLDAIDHHVRSRWSTSFAELAASDQDAVIQAWADGELTTFGELDGRAFFTMVRDNVAEGLFCDPSHGGNHGLIGWRWLGYPGVGDTDYRAEVERYDAPYEVEPRPLDRPGAA